MKDFFDELPFPAPCQCYPFAVNRRVYYYRAAPGRRRALCRSARGRPGNCKKHIPISPSSRDEMLSSQEEIISSWDESISSWDEMLSCTGSLEKKPAGSAKNANTRREKMRATQRIFARCGAQVEGRPGPQTWASFFHTGAHSAVTPGPRVSLEGKKWGALSVASALPKLWRLSL